MRASLVLVCVLLPSGGWGDTFQLHRQRINAGPQVSALATADLNDDGMPDIVAANRGRLLDPLEERPAENRLSLLIATGPLAYDSQPPLPTGFGPYAIAVGNFDDQPATDVLVANLMAAKDRDLTVLRNLGQLLFEPLHFGVSDDLVDYVRMRDADERPVFTTPGLTSIAVGDFNGDMRPDVLATGWASDVLVQFTGAEETIFGEPFLLPARGGPRDIVTRDLDGDGHLDAAVTMYSSHEITIWQGTDTGSFHERDRFSSRGRLPHKIALEDVNGDGRPDLLVSHVHTDDSITIFFGDGGFQFEVSQEIMFGEDRERLEYEIRDLVVADVNGDDRPDVALAAFAAREVILLINETDRGEVPATFRQETYGFRDSRPRVLCPGDFNGDGKLDLAVALWESDRLAFLLGR